jgi:hypothetical protein
MFLHVGTPIQKAEKGILATFLQEQPQICESFGILLQQWDIP